MPTPSGLAPQVTPTGITAGSYSQWLAFLIGRVQAIKGADVYLGNDSQDFQLIADFAQALADCCAGAVQVYNSFSPTTAQGAGLSSNVKINGLKRLVPTSSTAVLTVVGVANTTITNGLAIDVNGKTWALPSTVIIPGAGTIDVLATCTSAGAVNAAPNTIGDGTLGNGIQTPISGWQTVTNAAAAIPGAPVETDAALRNRQSQSTSLPSQTIFEGIVAAIRNTPGVTRARGYENNTAATDGNGTARNTLYFLVEGGAQAAIFNSIILKITPGIGTRGAITQVVTDANGSTRTLAYDLPTDASIAAALTIKMGTGWDPATEALITAAYVDYTNALPIGVNVSYIGAMIACSLLGTDAAGTFTVSSASTLKKNAGSPAAADVAIAFNEAPVAGAVTFTLI